MESYGKYFSRKKDDISGQEGDLARMKFLDHFLGKRYLKELNNIDKLLNEKYQKHY